METEDTLKITAKANQLTKDWVYGLVKLERNKEIDLRHLRSTALLEERAIAGLTESDGLRKETVVKTTMGRADTNFIAARNFVENNLASIVATARREMQSGLATKSPKQ